MTKGGSVPTQQLPEACCRVRGEARPVCVQPSSPSSLVCLMLFKLQMAVWFREHSSPGKPAAVRQRWGFAPGGGGGNPGKAGRASTFMWPRRASGSPPLPAPPRELREPCGRVLRPVQQDWEGLRSPVSSCQSPARC
ncbi:unnamed protein product [Rangifer tarandus platyrhynchus]|uniref:Uncharacterized protein n=2 Tax=Rangifer tarandus platyrhynchus TaxID=3082113 RepID=A0ABN8ZES9_RANTA|nr:unnamed protein product [Rangifer tarandus platyrhynchus]CAI9706028.1 unnamed protein product [Rangifer tarandus platyrhynchus]